jgi:DNA polymerase V
MIRSYEKRAEQKVSGFQSPAADYLEGRLDLAEKLVVDPHSTFYFQMQGDAMISFGISDADLLVIDRSLKPDHGAFVIAFISGNLSCRLFLKEGASYLLRNDSGSVSETELGTLQVWGVVTSICRNVLPKPLRRGRYGDVCTL